MQYDNSYVLLIYILLPFIPRDPDQDRFDPGPPETEAESFLTDNLICVKADTQTDDIADLIQKKFVHHLVVVDGDGNFAGVASSWDVAREVSLDAKAFPYNRELWTKTKTGEMPTPTGQ